MNCGIRRFATEENCPSIGVKIRVRVRGQFSLGEIFAETLKIVCFCMIALTFKVVRLIFFVLAE